MLLQVTCILLYPPFDTPEYPDPQCSGCTAACPQTPHSLQPHMGHGLTRVSLNSQYTTTHGTLPNQRELELVVYNNTWDNVRLERDLGLTCKAEKYPKILLCMSTWHPRSLFSSLLILPLQHCTASSLMAFIVDDFYGTCTCKGNPYSSSAQKGKPSVRLACLTKLS